jgi:hypothetical protein
MNIIVQKYGGSSVADKEKLDIIIKKNPKQTFYLYLDLKILEREFTNIV